MGGANIPFMASARARVYKGVWGQCPQWGLGAKPLVRGSGGLRPPEAEAFLALEYQFSCKNVPILILYIQLFSLDAWPLFSLCQVILIFLVVICIITSRSISYYMYIK